MASQITSCKSKNRNLLKNKKDFSKYTLFCQFLSPPIPSKKAYIKQELDDIKALSSEEVTKKEEKIAAIEAELNNCTNVLSGLQQSLVTLQVYFLPSLSGYKQTNKQTNKHLIN
jgi:23S rRNA A1618 N6-methylase RlmF